MLPYFFLPFLFLPFLAVFSSRRDLTPGPVTLSRVLRISGSLLLVLVAVSIVSILIGSTRIGTIPALKELLYGWRDGYVGLAPEERTIIFSIRLPRVIFAGLVGASLSLAGVAFQGLLRNPLADPYILGISGGAAVGAVIGIIAGAGTVPFGISGLAFAGSLLTIVLVFSVAKTKGEMPSNTLLLAGVIVNAFFTAVIMFLISTSSHTQLRTVMFWLMGDLSFAEGREILLTGLFLLAGFVVCFRYAKGLNLIVTGEETALQLGVDVERTRKVLLVTASLVTAVAVSVSGTIGFVGLIIPHMMRMLWGSDHRLLLPASMLFGGAFLVAADTIARTAAAPSELPVGVITALCGAPYFIYLLRRKTL